MSASDPNLKERPLAEGPCAVMIGPMSLSGYITLTTRRVYFEPTPFSRRVGVEPWSVEIASIRAAYLVGTESRLTIECQDRPPALVGLGARIVHERLTPLLTDDTLTYQQGDSKS